MEKGKFKNGFTLIELILVVVIVSLIAAISSPFYSRFLLQNSVENTTSQLLGTLRKAQTYAMAGKQTSAWSVNYSSNTITLYIGTTFAGHDNTYDETFSVNPNVTLSCPLCTNGTDISFARINGSPTPTAATITISSGNNSEIITLNSQGVVTR